MEAYSGFAPIYDLFMGDVDYDSWAEYIKNIWEKYGKKPKLIAELGCGTGNITGRLAKMGYDMIGIDISEEMLLEAKEKEKLRKDSIQRSITDKELEIELEKESNKELEIEIE